MAINAQQRWVLIGGALLLTLGAMYMLQEPVDESAVESTDNKRVRPTVTEVQNKPVIAVNESLPDLSHKAIFVADASEKSVDLFKKHAWYVPPPPKPIVVKIEKPIPTAPPVPFFYIGKLENTPQGTLIFLSLRNKLVTVIAGQEVDKVWRLDKEDANALTLTYLPLGMTKVLSKIARPAVLSNTGAANNINSASNGN